MAANSPASSPDDLPGLRIVAVEHGSTSVIELEGEWDLAEREATREAAARALERRPECLVLDLNRLRFIDSTGIHGLLETHKRHHWEDARARSHLGRSSSHGRRRERRGASPDPATRRKPSLGKNLEQADTLIRAAFELTEGLRSPATTGIRKERVSAATRCAIETIGLPVLN